MSLRRRVLGSLLFALALLGTACLTQIPYAVENEWVRMTTAGMERQPVVGSPGRFQVQLVLEFEVKRLDIARMEIEDVSDAEPVLLARSEDVHGGDNRWTGAWTEMSPHMLPWLYTPGDTRRVLRITFHTAYDESSEVLQPMMFLESAKRAYRERGV